ncbi:methyl-accepting chemotaxis protein [Mobilisporobacter senegalensis]|uniref:Methyl-accepting chemotaxis protein n=1 Tax=Mobilisporobacter senegalensis TaxID=1329262 RepID=A0A3N1XKU0_9FIRM|nr:methyl-accepting chemotaxis protein [Mobilisporobacter senegalensis]ROR27329.1 methyl-accepting chemotaxis protein [Mobilisporobacter senegalensis]
MKWFNNMKIRAKLISCFIILSVFMGIVGVVGITNMNTINKRSEDMYYDNFIPVEELKNLQIALQSVRANQLLAIYEQNPETYQTRVDEINKLVEQTGVILENYEKTIHDDENRTLFDNFKSSLSAYRQVRDENLEYVKNQQYDKALETMDSVTQARVKCDENAQVLVDYNTNLAETAVKENADNFAGQSIIMIVVIIAGVVIAIILGLVISNIISKQLNKLVSVANQIADGNLDVVIDIHTKDEVGILSKAFRKMSDNLNNVMSNINSAAEQVATGARQVSDSSMALSQGSTEQASSVEELTASLEEISSQTQLNAENAKKANGLSVTAKEDALQGDSQMKDMLKSMEEINESSANIYKIIKVIDDIAFQTNILALNAAVEAARAGQHGKGFAVVAEEVRTLAARSANAAKETTDLIEDSIKKAENGTVIAKDTAGALNKIVDGIEEVAAIVKNIAIASEEQATGIAQINQGIIQVSEVVQNNSATSEESAAASEELSSQAVLLKELVGNFKLKQSKRLNSNIEEISPDVLQMLENMTNKKDNITTGNESSERKATKPTITLSDTEYGKY